MYSTSDIYPVSDFSRKTNEHIKRLQETMRPEVLTVNGKAAVVMVDPESYDKLAQEAELARTLSQMALAKAEHEAGESLPLDDIFSTLKGKLKAQFGDESV